MQFVLVPPGKFTMGSDPHEAGRQADEVAHEVALTRPFYLGRYEVTQGEWTRLMHRNPSQFPTCGVRCPVDTVTYDDAQEFIRRLTAAAPGNRFRLPTEAEWEYACRAGTHTPYSTGATLSATQANFDGRYPVPGSPAGPYLGHPSPAGSYPANPWGLFDMHGNLWEWTADWYAPYLPGPARDPARPDRAGAQQVWDARGGDWRYKRVIRGGSWYFDADSCRCALRYTHAPKDRGWSLGFRLVRDAPPPTAPAAAAD